MTYEPDHSSISPIREVFRNRGFLACLALLVILTGGFRAITAQTGSRPGPKEAVPLRKPLKHLDTTQLAPYELLHATDLKPEILDGLGTDKYIQWTLQDTSITDRSAPEGLVNLFVTYYTGTRSQVVHVPEECYLGSGYSTIGDEVIQVPIPELQQTLSAKVLTFERSAFLNRESRVVMYVFHVNGRFAPDGKVVTTIMNDPRDRYGYFSKVEVSFGNAEATPSYQKSVEAGKRAFQKILPILLKEHWPDWKEVESKNASVQNAKSSDAMEQTKHVNQ